MPRKYENTKKCWISLCANTAAPEEVHVRFASAPGETRRVVFSLSRDCESKRVRKLKCNAQCSTLCNAQSSTLCTAFAHPPPPPSSFCFILGVVLLRFVGCWGFVGILEKVMSMKGHCRKKTKQEGMRMRNDTEWRRNLRTKETKLGQNKNKGNSSAAAVIRVESS